MDTIADRPDTMTTTTSAERRSRRKATRASGPPGRSSIEVVSAVAPVSPGPDRTERRITSMWRRVRLGRIGFRRPAAVLAIVALLASISVAGTAWHDHRRIAGNADHEAAIVEVARQGVTALINIRGDQADADFARLSAITAPPFSDELHDQSKNYLQAVRDAKVASTGQVVAAGIVAAGDDTGILAPDAAATTVIVAADAQVTNPDTHQPERRAYRFSVKVQDVDGTLKVTDVEFVP